MKARMSFSASVCDLKKGALSYISEMEKIRQLLESLFICVSKIRTELMTTPQLVISVFTCVARELVLLNKYLLGFGVKSKFCSH